MESKHSSPDYQPPRGPDLANAERCRWYIYGALSVAGAFIALPAGVWLFLELMGWVA